MQTIYVDVLILLNIYVNYFLIKTTAKITHSPLKFLRCIAASAYGSLFSLLILVPNINTALNMIIKLAAAFTVVLAAFGRKNGAARFAVNSIIFFSVNLIFGGAVYAVYVWLEPNFIRFNNTYFYVDFSLTVLIFTTAALYFSVCAVRYFIDRIPEGTGYYKVIIRCKDKIVSMKGLADTGNSLVDFFSGKPIIICNKEKIPDVTGNSDFMSDANNLAKGFRLIPCSTVSGDGIIPIFKPDEVIIFDEKNGIQKSVEAMIGFSSQSDQAIFNPKLLKL